VTSMIVLDASVLIAAMTPSDPHHAKAREVLRAGARANALAAHRITVAESAVGAARSGQVQVLRANYARLGITMLGNDDDEPWRLARLRADTGLPMPDCCVLDAAIAHRATLGTFDQRLAVAAIAHGLVVA